MEDLLQMNEHDEGNYIIDITEPIQKPSNFDQLCALVNHYEDMEEIIDSLRKETSELIIDENPNDNAADRYTIEICYKQLFINILKKKMEEIRNVLNYN